VRIPSTAPRSSVDAQQVFSGAHDFVIALKAMSHSKRIHLIAACGTGMAALAGLLKAAGHKVSGSDANVFPPMSLLLEREGIPCVSGFDARNIDADVEQVVIGNAVRSDNPEVAAALARGIRYASMPETVADLFLAGCRPSVVVGTHGKTTTSSLLAWAMTSAGLDPGMMIGGWIKNFNGNYRLGSPPHFVLEGDEYDTAFFDKGPKFLHYRPHQAILTSVEYDHGDIYPDLAAIQRAFEKFIALLPPDGLLVAADDPIVSQVAQRAACPVASYGLNQSAVWQADTLAVEGGWMTFGVRHKGRPLGRLRSPLIGQHNVKNALAVAALLHNFDVPWKAIAEGIASFQGVKRRQETVGIVRDIRVIDDFAHHPTAITETLLALRLAYQPKRLWAVFEPRSASSRRKIFQQGFVSALAHADRTILAEVFAADKLSDDLRLDTRQVVADLSAQGKEAALLSTSEEIVAVLSKALAPGDVVCIMSSGGFGGIHGKLLAAL
jgi:UDP-N-acetylmuramate: L-alanyl-gamma-D-glutamyl-meso-diaminopimelate ligase